MNGWVRKMDRSLVLRTSHAAEYLSAESRERACVVLQCRGRCLWLSSAAVVIVVLVVPMIFVWNHFDHLTGRLGEMDIYLTHKHGRHDLPRHRRQKHFYCGIGWRGVGNAIKHRRCGSAVVVRPCVSPQFSDKYDKHEAGAWRRATATAFSTATARVLAPFVPCPLICWV